MIARHIVVALLALSLAGCEILASNRVTLDIYSQPLQPAYPILIDPSLEPEVNEYSRDNRHWFYGLGRKQRVVIYNSGPLKLAPATPEEVDKAMTPEQRQLLCPLPSPERPALSTTPVVLPPKE